MAQGGKSLNDRHQSARVRSKLLALVERILDGDDEKEKKELLYKMCGGLLPKLNEHTGEDGEAIKIIISKEISDRYETPSEPSSTSEGQAQI